MRDLCKKCSKASFLRMSKLSPTELVVLLFCVSIVWRINHFLIASGILSRMIESRFSNWLDSGEEFDATETVDLNYDDESNSIQDNDGLSDRVSQQQQQRLALMYEVIYGNPRQYVDSDAARTWLWLVFALLLNIFCIQLELLLFQDMMGTP